MMHYRLKELLRSKLVECGWRDIMKNHCRGMHCFFLVSKISIHNLCFCLIIEIIKQRGLDNVTAEDLVQELTPKGRAEVPAAVKVCAEEFLLIA